LELVVFFLGGSIPEKRSFKLRKPGAFHHARWMAKAIYYIKICIMSERFDLSEREQSQVERIATYVAVFYARSFLSSRIAVIAPSVDFKFFNMMKIYKEEDNAVATAALSSINRHLWYLTEECVVLALFDGEVPNLIRTEMFKKLLSIPRPREFLPKKPTFPKDNMLSSELGLIALVGPRSWLIFNLFGPEIKHEWMKLDAKYWPLMDDYCKLRDFLHHLEVVNDCAERGVKLISDFKDAVRDAEQLDFVLQVYYYVDRIVIQCYCIIFTMLLCIFSLRLSNNIETSSIHG